MAHRLVVVLVLLFTLTPPAHAADLHERLRVALEAANRIATRATTAPKGMQVADAPNMGIYVARVNADGTLATACVGTPEAAREFLSGKKKAAGPEKE